MIKGMELPMSENRSRPAFIKHYSEIQEPDDAHYPCPYQELHPHE